MKRILLLSVILLSVFGCRRATKSGNEYSPLLIRQKISEYKKMPLSVDLSHLSSSDRQVLEQLIEAAKVMDKIFWMQTYGDRSMLNEVDSVSATFVDLNYGPWERLNGNRPFITGVEHKPFGANFYPVDMEKDEFETYDDAKKNSSYTMLRRDTTGALAAIPYHQFFANELTQASQHLRQAAALTQNEPLKKYLNMRAGAFLNDGYYASDVAWLGLANNSSIDCVIGPMASEEDGLYGYKLAHTALVLVRNEAATDRIKRFSEALKKVDADALLLDEKYKDIFKSRFTKIQDRQLDESVGVYDLAYCSGAYNTGNKALGYNLPIEERIQAERGTRRILIKNVIREKFDEILLPVAEQMIDKEQLENVKFEAFLDYVMYREVSQGLLPIYTLNSKVPIRESLKETFVAGGHILSNVGSLYIEDNFTKMGLYDTDALLDSYVTFAANLLRSMRFGVSNARGRAAFLTFSYLSERGGIVRTDEGTYKIDLEKMRTATVLLFSEATVLFSEGDYASSLAWLMASGRMDETLSSDLGKLSKLNIPRDVYFEQGAEVLGLK